jgi:DNA-binding NarL/FixJ family response regulator
LSRWLSARALNHPHACPLRIHLTPEEDARLRELETNSVVPFKVPRRAQAVRLAAQGRTAPRIARRLGLDRTTSTATSGGGPKGE